MIGNLKKDIQLGMSHGKANNKLRKLLLFELSRRCGLNFCFQCGKEIETVDQFSIEHKIPWLDSESPIELFFNLDNIAFSHLLCNIGNIRKKYLKENGNNVASNRPRKNYPEKDLYWCSGCKQYKNENSFHKNIHSFNGRHNECKDCRREIRNKHP